MVINLGLLTEKSSENLMETLKEKDLVCSLAAQMAMKMVLMMEMSLV